MRQDLGQSSDADVRSREEELAVAVNEMLREWWCGLSAETMQALLEAEGKPGRVLTPVLAHSLDGSVREILIPDDAALSLPGFLHDESCE